MEKIMTLHPDRDKQGVNISKAKYDQIRQEIVAALESQGQLGFSELMSLLEQKLAQTFEGSVGWYYTTVKLDLEARGIIERVPGSKPQQLRLIGE